MLLWSNDGERSTLISRRVVVAEVDAQRDVLLLCGRREDDVVAAVERGRCLDAVADEVAAEVDRPRRAFISRPLTGRYELKLIALVSTAGRDILEGDFPDIVRAIDLRHLVVFSKGIPCHAVHPCTAFCTVTGNIDGIVFKRLSRRDSTRDGHHHGLRIDADGIGTLRQLDRAISSAFHQLHGVAVHIVRSVYVIVANSPAVFGIEG